MNYLYTIFVLLAISSVSVCSPDCCTITSKGEEVHVSCRGCGLDSVPEDLPLNTSVLDLTNNRIKYLNDKSFQNLQQLNNVMLTSNGLAHISSGAFHGLHNLRYLSLTDNDLNGSLDASVFHSLTNLTVLYIEKNLFHATRTYPEEALSSLWNIETLHIDIFEGFAFGNGFLNLNKLMKVEFHERLKEPITIRNSSFLGFARSELSHLRLNFRLREIEKDSFSPFQKLKSLYVNSQRQLRVQDFLQALYGLRGRTMDEIIADKNFVPYDDKKIHLVESDMLYLKTICVKRLYLRQDTIATIEMGAILSWNTRNCLEVLDLSQNKIVSYQFLILLRFFPSLKYLYFSYQIIRVAKRNRRYLHHDGIFFVPSSLIYLDLSHNILHSHLRNVTISKDNRIRHIDFSYPRNVVCSGARVKGLVYLTELLISGVHCSQPNPKMFADMINLVRLEARQCSLGDYMSSNSTSLFRGLHNITFVDISANNIQTLEPTTFNDQSASLNTLVLSGNRIERLPVPVLESLNVLEMLNMSDNVISTLKESEYSVLDKIQTKSSNFRINLNGNPLVCNCDNLDFLRWIYTSTLVYEKENLLCFTSHGNRDKLGNILENFEDWQESCVAFSWLVVSVLLFIIFSIAASLAFVSWKYSPRIRVWCRHPRECKYTHMAFLSYSADESSFARKLCDTLEEGGISCWCYDRDFAAGKDVAENIMDAIDSCHKSVFVVSYSMIHSEWLQFAMQVASRYSLRDGRESDNIVIMLDDIRLSEMPKLIRKIWDQIVCLKWPNENNTDTMKIPVARERFWETLSRKIRKGIPAVVASDEKQVQSSV